MTTYFRKVLPSFDFRTAEALGLSDRFQICIERAKGIVQQESLEKILELPRIPSFGVTDSELQAFEALIGISLPFEYRQFLSVCRYISLGDGWEVGGFGIDGDSIVGTPWLSQEHRAGVEYLVFAEYWKYADGDQLLIDIHEPGQPVIAYLHEQGPLFELYAPSFSLALWRLVHE